MGELVAKLESIITVKSALFRILQIENVMGMKR